MKPFTIMTLFIALLLSTVNLYAATGADLLKECKAVEVLATTDRATMTDEEQTKFFLEYSGPGLHCMGQLKAANYINNYYANTLYGYGLWCVTENPKVKMLDVVKHVVKYLEARPSSLDKSAASFIVWALQDAFPCPENKSLIELLKKSQMNPGDQAL